MKADGPFAIFVERERLRLVPLNEGPLHEICLTLEEAQHFRDALSHGIMQALVWRYCAYEHKERNRPTT